LAKDPRGNHGRVAGIGGQREAQNENLPIVPARLRVVRLDGGLPHRFAQDLSIPETDAKHSSEDTRLVPPLPVPRVERIGLQFVPKIGTTSVGQLHFSNIVVATGTAENRCKAALITSAAGGITGITGTDQFDINTGAFNGTSGFSNPLDGGTFSVSRTGNNLYLNYAPASGVPEPGTWATAALVLAGAALVRWRRRARRS
jgi:hypothetical protein